MIFVCMARGVNFDNLMDSLPLKMGGEFLSEGRGGGYFGMYRYGFMLVIQANYFSMFTTFLGSSNVRQCSGAQGIKSLIR